MSKRIEIANPSEKGFGTNAYLFRFGVVGTTSVLAYGYSVDEALEEAAEYLVECEYFGHITPHGEDLGCDCSDNPYECDSHTYTEAGWITDCYWRVSDVTRDALIAEFADKKGA